jgi:hypothetical protein
MKSFRKKKTFADTSNKYKNFNYLNNHVPKIKIIPAENYTCNHLSQQYFNNLPALHNHNKKTLDGNSNSNLSSITTMTFRYI